MEHFLGASAPLPLPRITLRRIPIAQPGTLRTPAHAAYNLAERSSLAQQLSFVIPSAPAWWCSGQAESRHPRTSAVSGVAASRGVSGQARMNGSLHGGSQIASSCEATRETSVGVSLGADRLGPAYREPLTPHIDHTDAAATPTGPGPQLTSCQHPALHQWCVSFPAIG